MDAILVLTSTYPRWPGDIEPAFVHYLSRQLAEDYRVIVLAPHYPGAAGREDMEGVTVHRFRYFFPRGEHLAYHGGIITNLKNNPLNYLLVPFFVAAQFFGLLRLARRYRVRLVHAHWVIPQCLLAGFARRLRLLPRQTRILCTSHGGDLFALQGGLLERLKRRAFRMADHVTVVSGAMQRRLRELGIDEAKVSVRPMGVDLAGAFVPDPAVSRRRDLVFVGRLVEKKGIPTLLEAVARLKRELPGLRLTIVGHGPDRETLEARVRALEIGEQVEFAGAVPNEQVPAYYQSAKIAVVPSVVAAGGDQEGLGLVAVEAMGCGCATVASDLPALADVIRDGETGLVFRAGDADDLAACLRRLLEDSGLRERLAENGRRYVAGVFDWAVVGREYRRLAAACLARGEA